eukprot:1627259-Pleurochrysis_carterae.AAC.1
MNAAPSRRSSSVPASGDVAGCVYVLAMHVGRQRFCKDVGHVLARVNLADLDASVRDVLSNLQVAPVAVSRALAGTPVLVSTARRRPSCPRRSESLVLPRAPSP